LLFPVLALFQELAITVFRRIVMNRSRIIDLSTCKPGPHLNIFIGYIAYELFLI
jgi:hypothetical protein